MEKAMTLQSPGHAKLKQQCVKYADDLGLVNIKVSWAEDIITKEHILTVTADTGTNEILFSESEIQNYDQGVGVSSANSKIMSALHAITD